MANRAPRIVCPECGKTMIQQFVNLKHCECGMSWKKDVGFFRRTSDMDFALEKRLVGGRMRQVPVIRYKQND